MLANLKAKVPNPFKFSTKSDSNPQVEVQVKFNKDGTKQMSLDGASTWQSANNDTDIATLQTEYIKTVKIEGSKVGNNCVILLNAVPGLATAAGFTATATATDIEKYSNTAANPSIKIEGVNLINKLIELKNSPESNAILKEILKSLPTVALSNASLYTTTGDNKDIFKRDTIIIILNAIKIAIKEQNIVPTDPATSQINNWPNTLEFKGGKKTRHNRNRRNNRKSTKHRRH